MVRRTLAAASLVLGFVLAHGCTVDDEPRPTLPPLNGSGGGSSNANTCYEPPGCQVVPNNKCLAKVDNQGTSRKTLCMSQLRVLAPATLATKLVRDVIVTPAVTQLDVPCLLKDVNKGGLFNWLIDFDTATGKLRTGGSRAIENLDEGYCFLKADFSGVEVRPAEAELVLDEATKTYATKAPIPQLAVPIFQKRDPNDVPILLPLRNAVITGVALSADGNCIGRYRAEAGEMSLDNDCKPSAGGVDEPTSYRFESGGKIEGIMTLDEADKVKIPDLKRTLCMFLTGKKAPDPVDGYDVCPRVGADLAPEALAKADSASTPGGPLDSVKLAAEFAASAIKIRDGECNLSAERAKVRLLRPAAGV